jgi:hypothetical protein
MKTCSLLMLSGVVLFDSLALAGEPPAMPDPPTFSELDANGDLLITEEEFRSFMEQRFAERQDGRRGPPGGRFNPIERADTDGDGALNEQEYQQMMERMLERGKRPRM